MSITTMEQLEQVAVGEPVTINRDAWTRVTGGLRRDQYVAPLSRFTSEVQQGHVTVGVTPEVGQLWTYGGYFFHLIQPDSDEGEGFWRVIHFYSDGSIVGLSSWSPTGNAATFVSMEERPAWHTLAVGYLATCWQREWARHQSTERQVETLRQQVRDANATTLSMRQGIEASLQDLQDDGDLDVDNILDMLRDDHGVDRPRTTEEVQVTIEVSGHTQVYMDTDDGQRLAPGGTSVTNVDSFEVDWDYTFTQTFTVNEDQCACDEVSMNSVEEYMREHEIIPSRFDYTATCSNC